MKKKNSQGKVCCWKEKKERERGNSDSPWKKLRRSLLCAAIKRKKKWNHMMKSQNILFLSVCFPPFSLTSWDRVTLWKGLPETLPPSEWRKKLTPSQKHLILNVSLQLFVFLSFSLYISSSSGISGECHEGHIPSSGSSTRTSGFPPLIFCFPHFSYPSSSNI